MTAVLRLHQFVSHTRAEGPGVRSCLWVRGCSIRCPGCFNAHMWSPVGGHDVPVDALAEKIRSTEGIEGVTFLGGEPFEQALPLAALARSVRAAGLSVMTFSGFTFEQLATADAPGWQELLDATDLLVDGPFDIHRPEARRPWIGSSNQRVRFLTDRYAHLAPRLAGVPDRVEVRVRPDGTVFLNGMATPDQLRAIRRQVVG